MDWEGENHSEDMDAKIWVSLEMTISVTSLQDEAIQRRISDG